MDLAGIGQMACAVWAAVASGASPVDAVSRATLAVARRCGLQRVLGSIAPTRLADLQIVASLGSPEPPDLVIAGGRIAAERGRPLFDNADQVPGWALASVTLPPDLYAGSFTSPCTRWSGRRDGCLAAVEIAGLAQGVPSARVVRLEPAVREGAVVADPVLDLSKVAVIERTGRPGGLRVGVLRGTGLTRGAIGMTTTTAPGDMVVIGADDDDMFTAARSLEGMGGGFVVVERGWVRAACPLPIAGVLSDSPWEAVLGQLTAVDAAARALGCRVPAPFLTLSALGVDLYTQP